jgi:hypothetical protein
MKYKVIRFLCQATLRHDVRLKSDRLPPESFPSVKSFSFNDFILRMEKVKNQKLSASPFARPGTSPTLHLIVGIIK